MKKIEYCWHAIYFILWKMEFKSSMFLQKKVFERIMPLCIPKCLHTEAMKKPQIVYDYYSQKKGGLNHWFAANSLIFLASANFSCFAGILLGIMTKYNIGGILIWLAFSPMLAGLYISERLVLHKNRYLSYFPKFEKKPRNWKIMMAIIACLLFIEGWAMLFLSCTIIAGFFMKI